MGNIVELSTARSDMGRYTDRMLLDALREVAGTSPVLTVHAYEAETSRRHGGLPNRSTISRRFGSWNDAVKAAGLTPVPRHWQHG